MKSATAFATIALFLALGPAGAQDPSPSPSPAAEASPVAAQPSPEPAAPSDPAATDAMPSGQPAPAMEEPIAPEPLPETPTDLESTPILGLPELPGTLRSSDYSAPTQRPVIEVPQPKFPMRDRIRFRQLRTQVLKDPKFGALMEEANAAETDYEKREALKKYYEQLFAGMRKQDKELVERFSDEETAALAHLQQVKILPTEKPADKE